MGLNLLYAQVRLGVAQPGEEGRCTPLATAVQGLGWLRCQALISLCRLQTVSDIEHGWILVNKEQHRQLKSLQEKVSKKEVGEEGTKPRLGQLWHCSSSSAVLRGTRYQVTCCGPGSAEPRWLCPQFIRLAQTLKYYGYLKFDPCVTDFPEKGCHVVVSAGNNELNFQVRLPSEQIKEGSFKVTRMRCWRVTSSVSGAWRAGRALVELVPLPGKDAGWL